MSVAEPDRVRDAARELYTEDPGEFTGRRAELAGAARKSGDAAAARDIAGLRKPTRAAWVVNRLVHAGPDVPARLAALGADLRAAEESLDGRRIRELSQQRRKLIADLTRRALAEAGQPSPPASLQEEVSATLDAALADPQVADDLAAGRLLRPVERAGFGFGEPSGDLAPDQKQKPQREREPKRKPARRERDGRSGAKAGRAQADAERERAEAEQAREAERARAQAERARAEEQRRREAIDAARQAVSEADEAVEAAEFSEREAAEAVDDLQRQLGDAYRRQADARRQARQAGATQRKARQALDRLEKG